MFLKIILDKYFMLRIEHVKFQFVKEKSGNHNDMSNIPYNFMYLYAEHVSIIYV